MLHSSRRLALGAVALAVGASLAGVAPAAHADSEVSTKRGTLFSGCHDYPVTLDVSYPGAASWSAQISAYTPAGEFSTGFYSYGRGGTETVEDAVFLCGHEGPGAWTLDGTVTYLDADGQELATESVTAAMPLIRAGTRTELRASDRTPARGDVLGFKIISTERQRTGWRANGDDAVALLARCAGDTWARVPGKRLTSSAGTLIVRVRYAATAACRVRARTLPASDARASWSQALRLRPGTSDAAVEQRIPAARTARLPRLG